MLEKIDALHETNPMLGLRGVRLGIQLPELTRMQVRAIFEVPRAALTAGKQAEQAQFFSFSTNDLTQTTCAISRDDAEKGFLIDYTKRKILPANPFATIDQEGVGQLMKWAVEQGRKTRPDLENGICGEHGGDPETVAFCHRIGLNYVSCSPLRVPIARPAAGQQALRERGFTAK